MRMILRTLTIIGLTVIVISCDKHEKRETKYDNGQPHEKFSVLETKDGSFIKDGEYKTWYPSGQPESAGQYENGKQMGNWKLWFSNGQMNCDYNFVRDTLDGAFAKWYENGQKLVEGSKRMGKDIGSWTMWYENGQMNKKLNFNQEGKSDGLQTQWHNSGQKASEENYVKGIKEGELQFWNSNGKIYLTRIFKNGTDLNLPATYKDKSGETLNLFADETYKITYLESVWFSTQWTSSKGKFELTADKLNLIGFRNFDLEKFTSDTIIVKANKDILFIKKKDTK